MADAEHQTAVMLDHVDENQLTVNSEMERPLMAVAEENVMEGETVNEDILQQALEVASQSFDQTVAYTTEDGITVDVADGSIITGAGSVANITSEVVGGTTYTYVSAVPTSETVDSMQEDDAIQTVCHIGASDMLQAEMQEEEKDVNNDAENCSDTVYTEMEQQQEPESVCQPTVAVVSGTTGAAPLGSSLNPIRIIQQGSQYTSVQQLTPEQLEQIMQVVQQQQLAKSTQEGGGSSVLYNSETQTRIVYRVIYPSELHAKNSSTNANIVTTSSGQVRVAVPSQSVMIHHSKRPYRRRKHEDDDRVETPELSKEEKEARKKHRPRTRSGRVSRPPKHMVQDYKHIHPVDWDEDYDDSDGGYSDFKLSDEEDHERDKKDSNYSAYVPLSTGKPRNWKCEMCDKAYIGRAGLARHYRMKPSHGKLDTEPGETEGQPMPTNGVDGALSDSNSTQDSVCISSVTSAVAPSSATVTTATTTTGATTTPQLPKVALKMKQVYQQDNTPARRKARLKEFVKQCDDEELMEIVLPRLAKVITLWEFLMMKVEKGRPPKLHLADMYHEFEALHKQVKKMCDTQLKPSVTSTSVDANRDTTQAETVNSNQLQVTNEAIAQSLGLKLGVYDIQDRPLKEEPTFQYKFLTSDPANLYVNPSQNAKRTVQIVAQSQIIADARPSKRIKLELAVAPSPVNAVQNVVGAVAVQNVAAEEGQVEEGVDTSLPPHLHGGDAPTPTSVPLEAPPQVEANGDVHLDEEPLPPDSPTPQQTEPSGQPQTTVVSADQDKVTTNGGMDSGQIEFIDQEAPQQMLVQLAPADDEQEQNADGEGVEEGQFMEGDPADGELLQTGEEGEGETTQVLIEGDVAQLMEHAQVFQTEDGLLVIQAADGSLQIHGQNGQAIPMETVQALLGMDFESPAEQMDTVEQVQQLQ